MASSAMEQKVQDRKYKCCGAVAVRSRNVREKPFARFLKAVVWMEMRLSQADAARRLNVTRGVVHLFWNQYQIEASVSRRHVPGRPRATKPAGDRFIALSARRRRISVPQLVADHSVASGRRISARTV
ncbi:HTH_Tnp_Tc3_2 domain-containing protein [Trichonephila clavipes]|uniref:HTH_Tnp_Tc3_2 domain-containing protein n=1 Tax=Trichonephila clavipes TaxID=2585209 RepID=A0A8X6W5P6_TRICX|nr:HTH_Tnp_Tc3_2 domain-containing protein [Trichonephila clavipes]